MPRRNESKPSLHHRKVSPCRKISNISDTDHRKNHSQEPDYHVFVGEKQTTFNVYKDVLTLHSGHFRKILEDGAASEIHLGYEHASPSAFACFAAWMLTAETDEGVVNSSDSFSDMFEGLWFLGEWL